MATLDAGLVLSERINTRNQEAVARNSKQWRRCHFREILAWIIAAVSIILALTLGIRQRDEVTCAGKRAVDVVEVQRLLRRLVGSLSAPQRAKAYYANVSAMQTQWLMCPIVQQCEQPLFGLSAAKMPYTSYRYLYQMLAVALGEHAFNELLLQESMNDLLGQMQTWATICAGTCTELDESYGHPALLPADLRLDKMSLRKHNLSYDECQRRSANRSLPSAHLWLCEDTPLLLVGDLDTASGQYFMGSAFDEPAVHPRTKAQTYISVYGQLDDTATGAFGFRFVGHHFDISLEFGHDGTIHGPSKYPQFNGHNPLTVAVAPSLEASFRPNIFHPTQYDSELDWLTLWNLFSGTVPYPVEIEEFLALTAVLPTKAWAPLDSFVSNATIGGLSFASGHSIRSVPHVALSSAPSALFDALWAVVTNALSIAQGGRPLPAELAEHFRQTGLLTFTTRLELPRTMGGLVDGPTFLYVLVQTPSYQFFAMVNLMHSFTAYTGPSNHMHAFFSPMTFLEDPRHFNTSAPVAT